MIPVTAPYAIHLSRRPCSRALSRLAVSQRTISVIAASSKRKAAERLCNPSMDQILLMADQAGSDRMIMMQVVPFRNHPLSLINRTRQTKKAARTAAEEICKGAKAARDGIMQANPHNTRASDGKRIFLTRAICLPFFEYQ